MCVYVNRINKTEKLQQYMCLCKKNNQPGWQTVAVYVFLCKKDGSGKHTDELYVFV